MSSKEAESSFEWAVLLYVINIAIQWSGLSAFIFYTCYISRILILIIPAAFIYSTPPASVLRKRSFYGQIKDFCSAMP